MRRLAAPKLTPGDIAVVAAIEFFVVGGLQGWASMNGYNSL